MEIKRLIEIKNELLNSVKPTDNDLILLGAISSILKNIFVQDEKEINIQNEPVNRLQKEMLEIDKYQNYLANTTSSDKELIINSLLDYLQQTYYNIKYINSNLNFNEEKEILNEFKEKLLKIIDKKEN